MNEPSIQDILAAVKANGHRGAARALGISLGKVQRALRRHAALEAACALNGRVRQITPLDRQGDDATDGVRRYILTVAQNNTAVHEGFLENLEAYAKHIGASILVARCTYNKSAYAGSNKIKGQHSKADADDVWFDPAISGYVVDRRVQLAKSLFFCAELNILPTAVRPLSGFQGYCGRSSAILPHTKIAMQSIPSIGLEGCKLLYTTGAVTLRNYTARKEGQKGDFHHTYGASLVEVSDDGWWVRQINATDDGSFYDLDAYVEGGAITRGNDVEAIQWGDIHLASLQAEQREVAWGRGGMMDTLRPRLQFMHDILDFKARNGHTIKKGLIHDRFRAYCAGHDSVEDEVAQVGGFLRDTQRQWCETVVVESNHDRFMLEWLRIADAYKDDPVNAVYWLEAQAHVYKTLRANPKAHLNLLEWGVLRWNHGYPLRHVRFLKEDESFTIAGDVECAQHGHLGPNGARGAPANLATMGRKMNTGHTHSAGIVDGIYTAGITGDLDQGYNRGPSSWSHSHIVTYANGKRTIVTVWKGRWRA